MTRRNFHPTKSKTLIIVIMWFWYALNSALVGAVVVILSKMALKKVTRNQDPIKVFYTVFKDLPPQSKLAHESYDDKEHQKKSLTIITPISVGPSVMTTLS